MLMRNILNKWSLGIRICIIIASFGDKSIMKNLFHVLPTEFFKPLTSKYKTEYADCILLIFNSFKPEISYGVSREIVVKVLEEYFEADDNEMTFDEQIYI